MTHLFTHDDIGCYACYADGAFGHQHLRLRLHELALDCGHCIPSLAPSEDEWPDDLWDEDEALQVLAEHTAPGLTWVLDAGDLILMTESEAEEYYSHD